MGFGSTVSSLGVFLTWYDLIGFFAVFLNLVAFSITNKQLMRFFGLASTSMFGLSVLFYGGLNGVFVTLVSILIKLLSLAYKEDDIEFLKKISPLFALVFFLFFNPEGVYGILPAVSLIFIAIADTQKSLLKMKYWYFGSVFCWMLYAIHIGSVPAVMFDVVGVIGLLVGIYRIKSSAKEEVAVSVQGGVNGTANL